MSTEVWLGNPVICWDVLVHVLSHNTICPVQNFDVLCGMARQCHVQEPWMSNAKSKGHLGISGLHIIYFGTLLETCLRSPLGHPWPQYLNKISHPTRGLARLTFFIHWYRIDVLELLNRMKQALKNAKEFNTVSFQT